MVAKKWYRIRTKLPGSSKFQKFFRYKVMEELYHQNDSWCTVLMKIYSTFVLALAICEVCNKIINHYSGRFPDLNFVMFGNKIFLFSRWCKNQRCGKKFSYNFEMPEITLLNFDFLCSTFKQVLRIGAKLVLGWILFQGMKRNLPCTHVLISPDWFFWVSLKFHWDFCISVKN